MTQAVTTKFKHIVSDLWFEYTNYQEGFRKKTNEELYEGWMRSDFTNSKLFFIKHSGVRVVRRPLIPV